MSREGLDKLAELIRDIEIAMLTTVDQRGHLHSRPMLSRLPDGDFTGELWFFTSRSSGKVLSVAHDDRVNLAYSAPEEARFVSIAGRAETVNNHAQIKSLWTPDYLAWFPEGVDDPDLTLLKVTVESAEYWDAHASKVVQVFGLAKAILTGKHYDNGSEHERVDLHP